MLFCIHYAKCSARYIQYSFEDHAVWGIILYASSVQCVICGQCVEGVQYMLCSVCFLSGIVQSVNCA